MIKLSVIWADILPAALRLPSDSGGVNPVRTVVTNWRVSTQVRKRIRLQDPVTDRFGSAKIFRYYYDLIKS